MALVSYDYGSGSEPEITDEEEVNQVAVNPQRLNGESFKPAEAPSNLFSHLPEARQSTSTVLEETEDQLEDFIPTVKTLKEKKKVQITIPALSDFDDLNEDEPLKKRIKPSDKGSGLLGLLPPVQTTPKTSTMFVPNTVKKKLIPAQVKTSKTVVTKPRVRTGSDSDTDGEDIPVPETFDDQMWEKVCGRPKFKKPVKIHAVQKAEVEVEELTSAPEPEKPYDGLDNTAFKELVGKTKRPLGNIKLIDINEEEIMPDKDLWMTKSLTDPELQPKAEPEETVDPTKKRKHHITYLAERAKATEQELKAAWATSKNNRMMSRAKYGF